VVTQVKTVENDGYSAVQVGYVDKKDKIVTKDGSGRKAIAHRNGVTKAEKGHFDKAGVSGKRYVKEFRFDNAEEYALAHGIDKSVAAMTEQEKALLRSLVLMEGASRIGAIGDFAKTLESPANAMRVLRQQITQLGRAIGTVFVPILIQVIPWVQAFVEILTEAIQRFAVLVGFEMPEWETNDWGEDIKENADSAADSVGDTTDELKKLKQQLLGIDELNIIGASNEIKLDTGEAGKWTDDLEIPDIWDKTALDALKKQVDEIKPVLKDLLDNYIIPIALEVSPLKEKEEEHFKNPESSILDGLFIGRDFDPEEEAYKRIQRKKRKRKNPRIQ